MRKLTLARFSKSDDGVLGRLIDEAGIMPRLYTFEEEDLCNARNISCIPPGSYICKRTVYHRHGIESFEVTGVPNRTRILFHVGNHDGDTAGCILVGLRSGELRVRDEEDGEVRMKKAVLQSRPAFDRFMEALEGVDEFTLDVIEAYACVAP